MKHTHFAVAGLLVLAACERIPDAVVVCPPYIGRSLRVTVQDSVTGANVTPGATVIAGNVAYTDSVVAPPEGVSVYVGYGSGNFTVTVRQSSYLAWTKTGVKVEAGECVPLTVDLTARLKRAPA